MGVTPALIMRRHHLMKAPTKEQTHLMSGSIKTRGLALSFNTSENKRKIISPCKTLLPWKQSKMISFYHFHIWCCKGFPFFVKTWYIECYSSAGWMWSLDEHSDGLVLDQSSNVKVAQLVLYVHVVTTTSETVEGFAMSFLLLWRKHYAMMIACVNTFVSSLEHKLHW